MNYTPLRKNVFLDLRSRPLFNCSQKPRGRPLSCDVTNSLCVGKRNPFNSPDAGGVPRTRKRLGPFIPCCNNIGPSFSARAVAPEDLFAPFLSPRNPEEAVLGAAACFAPLTCENMQAREVLCRFDGASEQNHEKVQPSFRGLAGKKGRGERFSRDTGFSSFILNWYKSLSNHTFGKLLNLFVTSSFKSAIEFIKN